MENTDLIIDSSAGPFYSKSSGTLFSSSKKSTPGSPIVKNTSSNSTPKIAKWGEDNLFPQTVLKECESNDIIPTALDWKARALYSGGIVCGKTEINGDGEEIFKVVKDNDFLNFKKTSGLNLYLWEACPDFYWFYNVFPELVLSNDRKKIVSITTQEASYCRWGLQNSKGLVEKCYINANWNENENEDSKYTTTVPVLDPYYDPVTGLKDRDDSFKYIFPVSYPTPGKTYYQLAHWNSIRKSGWLNVSNEIVKFKEALLKNQLTIKYHVQIPDYYWDWKYKGFNGKSEKEKKQIIEDETKAFNNFLQGTEKAGKSIITLFKYDERINKIYPGWQIDAIDNKIKDGAYIEDSQEASSHILYALGVDATLIGSTPGKGLGAGSGSDKRVAFNIYMSLCRIHQDMILSPLELIRDYNGWDPELEFRFRNSLITTLDKGTQTQQQNQ